MPRRPAASSTAKVRYGLHAESGLRTSTRRDAALRGVYIGTRTSAERLARKRGSEAMGRCPTEADAVSAAEWLVDRLSRLAPSLEVESRIQAGGGQYLVVLTS